MPLLSAPRLASQEGGRPCDSRGQVGGDWESKSNPFHLVFGIWLWKSCLTYAHLSLLGVLLLGVVITNHRRNCNVTDIA